MEAAERDGVTARANVLKQELKVWEKDFAATNEGRKPSREDIKKNPEIGRCSLNCFQ